MDMLLAQGNPLDAVVAAQDLVGVYRALLGVLATLVILFFSLWQLEVSRARAALELSANRWRDMTNTLAGRTKDGSGEENRGAA